MRHMLCIAIVVHLFMTASAAASVCTVHVCICASRTFFFSLNFYYSNSTKIQYCSRPKQMSARQHTCIHMAFEGARTRGNENTSMHALHTWI